MGCDLSPLQVLAEFPELPFVPFGQDSPTMISGRDVGEDRALALAHAPSNYLRSTQVVLALQPDI